MVSFNICNSLRIHSHSSPQRRTSSHKMKENVTRHDYDVPHKSSSFDYGMMPLYKSETPQIQDQSQVLLQNDEFQHSYLDEPDVPNDFQGHNTHVSSHAFHRGHKNGGSRRKRGFSSFFDIRKQPRTHNRGSLSYRPHESFSNQKTNVIRSRSIDSIGHSCRTPPPFSRNKSNIRFGMNGSTRGTNKRKSFTGSLNSLLDGHSTHQAHRKITSTEPKPIQKDETRIQRKPRSLRQSPQRVNRTRSNSRDRSIAASLDSLFMVNRSNHASPKNSRSSRAEMFDKNKSNFHQSQKTSRTRSRSGSMTPPLLPRKGSLKKISKHNGQQTHLTKEQHTRNGSVRFEDTSI